MKEDTSSLESILNNNNLEDGTRAYNSRMNIDDRSEELTQDSADTSQNVSSTEGIIEPPSRPHLIPPCCGGFEL